MSERYNQLAAQSLLRCMPSPKPDDKETRMPEPTTDRGAELQPAIGYVRSAAEEVMRLECPTPDASTCPRCIAKAQLATALDWLLWAQGDEDACREALPAARRHEWELRKARLK